MNKYLLAVVAVLIAVALMTSLGSKEEPPAEHPNVQPAATATEQQAVVDLPRVVDAKPKKNSSASLPNVSEDFVAAWFDQVRISDHPKDQLLAAFLSKENPADKEGFLL